MCEAAAALRECAEAIMKIACVLQASAARYCAATTNPRDAWPTLMTTATAARYCGFRTAGAIRKAHLEGRLSPAGRRGGVGAWMWARSELDAFLCGGRGKGGPMRSPQSSEPFNRADARQHLDGGAVGAFFLRLRRRLPGLFIPGLPRQVPADRANALGEQPAWRVNATLNALADR
jgi:hypothetical protein